jgi:hypothetical protein
MGREAPRRTTYCFICHYDIFYDLMLSVYNSMSRDEWLAYLATRKKNVKFK